MLQYFSALSSSQEYIFSFYCIYRQTGIDSALTSFYIEVIKYGLLPIICSAIAALLWYLYSIYKRKKYDQAINLKQNIIVTSFVIVYLLYPTISNLCFSLFNCYLLDDGKSYLMRDFSIECWVGSHRRISLAMGLTFILIWVIGFPVTIFLILLRNRQKFNDADFIE